MFSVDSIDIHKEVEARLLGMTLGHRPRVARLIEKIMDRIPKKDLCFLLEKNIRFILPGKCSLETVLVNPFSADDQAGGLIPVCLICLKTDLPLLADHEFIYIVAHELAHVVLQHWKLGVDSDFDEMEIEADRQVIRWGFEDSLRKTPYNYLYGSGLDSYNLI